MTYYRKITWLCCTKTCITIWVQLNAFFLKLASNELHKPDCLPTPGIITRTFPHTTDVLNMNISLSTKRMYSHCPIITKGVWSRGRQAIGFSDCIAIALLALFPKNCIALQFSFENSQFLAIALRLHCRKIFDFCRRNFDFLELVYFWVHKYFTGKWIPKRMGHRETNVAT